MRIRRIMLLAALAAMLVILAIPVAFAQDRDERREERLEERFEEDGFFFFDGDRFDDDDFDNGSRIGQDFDQEAESGDVAQSFDVSSAGDTSNQCVGIRGVANTGNAQNQTSILQYGSEADDFKFEDSGADIDVSPEASTTCDQQVNQAAAASGGK